MAARTLYICYFGVREPLVQTQVIPYLLELAKDGIQVSLLTFEPGLNSAWTSDQIRDVRTKLAAKGIAWSALPYHKWPSALATAYDVVCGAWFIRRAMGRERLDVLHGRVHVPALMATIARRFSRHKPKILFDIRGFVPEEYTDAGVWPANGLLYRMVKRIERWLIRDVDGFVVLTEKARDILFPGSLKTGTDERGRPVEVIPCCVDFKKRFFRDDNSLRAKTRSELNLNGRQVITHVGALVGLYMTPQIIEFLTVARRRDSTVFALFLTQSDPADIIARLHAAGFSEGDFLVKKVDQNDVPAYLCASDIGLSFVKSSYATISRSPTKIPEYLACGLPVIANRGVGDVDELIASNRLGAVLEEFTAESYVKALDEVYTLQGIRDRAISTARQKFDLEEIGGNRYRRLYSQLVPQRFKALYICYFGVREPLVQTQVLPYLREVGKAMSKGASTFGVSDKLKFPILTFEPSTPLDTESIRSNLAEEGIDWRSLPYHKRISAVSTAWDILRGSFYIYRFIALERPDVLHGRAHIPTLMGALARKLSRHKPELLFDIRGFFPEEYTDAGVWPEDGWLYRLAKRVENWLMREANGFVVLTEKAREILFPESRGTGFDMNGRPVEVIPCCVDLEKFRAADDESRQRIRARLGVGERRVIAYVGSFGGWYLTDKMLDFFAAARESNSATFVMILTQRDSQEIVEKLRAKGFGDSDYFVDAVKPAELPQYLAAADLAVSFIKACYSKQSSSPTKIAEYLAAGLPIVANAGVGDVDKLIVENNAGVLVADFSPKSYGMALDQIARLDSSRPRYRDVAVAQFDLETVGGERYRRLYQKLLGD